MIKIRLHYFSTILIILLFSCNNPNINFEEDIIQQDNGENTNPRTTDDVREDFNNLEINPGINDLILESKEKDFFWNFRIIAPQDASNTNKKPLIFSLHGGAQNNFPDAHKNTNCLITPGIEGIIDAFIISPNSNAMLWYEEANQIQILALYDLITSKLPIDMSKIAITGYSDGGNGTWFYSQFYSNLFSAAIPMASSYNTINNDGSFSKMKIPLYVIHGSDDLLFPLEITQGYINDSINAGSEIQFEVATDLDHYEVCDYVPFLRNAAHWLLEIWNN